MDLVIVGVNHQTAPVELREKVAFTPDNLGAALHSLRENLGYTEVSILSTCNRTEIYAVAERQSEDKLASWLASYHDLSTAELSNSLYHHEGVEALRHLMRVAAGLDSMILGEPQILGQLKTSFAMATDHNTMGSQLNRISQHTFRIAKRVRTETAIGESTISAASTAVDLASQLFANLAECNALLVGAGETVEIVGQHLVQKNIKQLVIANRTEQNAVRLATELGGQPATLEDLPKQLIDADIVISSTASEEAIIDRPMAEAALKARKHRPIFMVDLAVPRDIDPEVNELRDIYLYSIDDLQQIISDNLNSRTDAAEEAEKIITEASSQFAKQDKSREVTDTLVKFRQQHDIIKSQELEKALKRLENGDDPKQILTSLANQLTNKIMHQPSVRMKQAKVDGRDDILQLINQIFDLDE